MSTMATDYPSDSVHPYDFIRRRRWSGVRWRAPIGNETS
jgi:hypothetical protein